MSIEEDIQHLSLVENEIHEESHVEDLNNSKRASGFWKGLFRKRNSTVDETEDESLLASSPNLDYSSRRGDDEDLDDYRDGEQGPDRNGLLQDTDDDNDDEDDEDDDDNDSDDEEESESEEPSQTTKTKTHSTPLDLLSMNASDYNAEAGSNDDESCDSSSDDDSDEDSNGSDEEDPEKVAPVRWRPLARFKRSQSSYSDRKPGEEDEEDDDDSVGVDSSNRKNIHGRIEGFGSPEAKSAEENPRTVAQRLRELASQYRMKRMSIGTEDTIQRKTFLERFDDVVDRVLPPDPELDGYIDAFHLRSNGPEAKNQAQAANAGGQASHSNPSNRRSGLGNLDDKNYIRYLEKELQTKELELNSWKRRVKELESTIKRLNGVEEGESDSSDSDDEEEEEVESEIEWQTGVAEEGILIDIDATDAVAQKTTAAEVFHSPAKKSQAPLAVNNSAPNSAVVDMAFPLLSSGKVKSETVWMDVTNVPPVPLGDTAECSEGEQEVTPDITDTNPPLAGGEQSDSQENTQNLEEPTSDCALVALDRNNDTQTADTHEKSVAIVSDDDDESRDGKTDEESIQSKDFLDGNIISSSTAAIVTIQT